MEKTQHEVTMEADQMRLDRFIRHIHPGVNQGRIEKLLRSGAVRIDGAKAASSARLELGQIVTMPSVITVLAPKKPISQQNPQVIALVRDSLIDKGDGWLAINKPSGLATQGGSGTAHHIDGALAAAFPDYDKLRLVHRLDRDTSGVLIIATTLVSARHLGTAFQSQSISKTYLALLHGVLASSHGTINAPLLKSGGRGHEKMIVDDGGQAAITHYKVLATRGDVTLAALSPQTGRTHQLRAHMAHLGCPLLGDGKYGGKRYFPDAKITRLCLHAAVLTLPDCPRPVVAPLPDDMRLMMKLCGFDADISLEGIAR